MKPTVHSYFRHYIPRFHASLAVITFGLLGAAAVHATTFTWDGTNNAPWSDAKWSDGVSSGVNWSNGGSNDAIVNSGDVWSPISISANSLTIGDGSGDPSSTSARFSTNNAFWGISTITIHSDGYLGGSANCTSHLLTVNLNGGIIGGSDNGGDAAFYGVIALHGPVYVNGGSVTSTISTTGGGIVMAGPTSGADTEFNVADGAADVDLLVSGSLVHKPFGDAEKLLKTGMGTMVLSGTNSYAGGTTVNVGTLSIRGASAMPSGGSVTIHGGTLDVAESLGGGGGDYNWYWGVASTVIHSGGKLSINSHSHIRNLTLSGGELASTGVDPFYGYGSWVLDDVTTATGNTTSTISAQQVSANDGGFAVESGSVLNASGTIVNGKITKTGGGTMTLSGENHYGGLTTVNAGTLVVANSSALGAGSWSSVNKTDVNAGATLALQGGISVHEHMHVSGAGVGGLGAIRSLSGNNALTMFAGDGSSGPGYGLDGDVTIGVDADILTVTGFYHDSGSYGITKVGSGTLVLSSSSAYTGNTTVNAGTLAVASTGGLRIQVIGNSSNRITGAGSLSYDGALDFDLSAATMLHGSAWQIIDVDHFSSAVSYGSGFHVTSNLGNFTHIRSGVWSLTSGIDTWTFSTATGTLKLTTDFGAWADSYGITGGMTGDDDGDGLTNQQEYAFGLIPNNSASVNPITSQLDKTTGKFRYTRRATPATSGLTYTIWKSVDLVNWTEDSGANASQTVTGTTGGVETVEVTITGTLPLTQPKLFIQVRAN